MSMTIVTEASSIFIHAFKHTHIHTCKILQSQLKHLCRACRRGGQDAYEREKRGRCARVHWFGARSHSSNKQQAAYPNHTVRTFRLKSGAFPLLFLYIKKIHSYTHIYSAANIIKVFYIAAFFPPLLQASFHVQHIFIHSYTAHTNVNCYGNLCCASYCRTQYMRTAFQVPFDASVRISLDTNLCMINERTKETIAGDRWYRGSNKHLYAIHTYIHKHFSRLHSYSYTSTCVHRS